MQLISLSAFANYTFAHFPPFGVGNISINWRLIRSYPKRHNSIIPDMNEILAL